MQMMLNPNLDSDKSEIEVGRLIPFSGDSVELSSEKGYQTFCILILKQHVILINKLTFEKWVETSFPNRKKKRNEIRIV